jgi:NADPH:quinone reductase-like Zn-dependent oxidoreductase
MKTMRALRMYSYGGPNVLREETAPVPEPGAREVLIKVHAAGVNPLDWKVRNGLAKDWLNHKLPLIPGWDVSGVIESVGPGVSELKAGDAVYGLLDITRDGAYAEYVTARASDLAHKPKTIDHTQAAAVPVGALTAWQAMFDIARLTPEQTILIHGAAGGVGHFAVQLAKWKGARIIATSGHYNIGFLKELGADEVIDYHTTPFENIVSNVDVILDLIAGDTQERSWQCLKKDGILVSSLGISTPQTHSRRDVRGDAVMVRPNAVQLARLATLIDSGTVRPVVNTVMDLSEVARAHDMSQTGHVRGKIVLKIIE